MRNAVRPEWYEAKVGATAGATEGEAAAGGAAGATEGGTAGATEGEAAAGGAAGAAEGGTAGATEGEAAAEPRTEPRPLSFLYYGGWARYHEYEVCRNPVDDVATAHHGRRIWLGSDEPEIRGAVDEAIPYVPSPRDFARRLVETRPAVGLAPVGQDEYSRSRSELHWIEYSLAGAATVATRSMDGGPYDIVRDGVDGLLARNKSQWREQLGRLAASPALREELAGRARERVLAEYDVRQRVGEWADAVQGALTVSLAILAVYWLGLRWYDKRVRRVR